MPALGPGPGVEMHAENLRYLIEDPQNEQYERYSHKKRIVAEVHNISIGDFGAIITQGSPVLHWTA